MDLSKAFDAISCDLLITKLHAFGLSNDSNGFKASFSYLINRSRRTKVNWKFSSWKELNQRVPEGSVLRPLALSIVLSI